MKCNYMSLLVMSNIFGDRVFCEILLFSNLLNSLQYSNRGEQTFSFARDTGFESL